MIGIIRELIQKIKKRVLCYFKDNSKTEDLCLWKYEKGVNVKYLLYEKLVSSYLNIKLYLIWKGFKGSA